MRRVVVTGPESTGKSTLAAQLARALRAPLVPEFARYYVAHLGHPYTQADLAAIGRGQRAWQNYAQRTPAAWCVLDTDWTVLHIWELYGFCRNETGQFTLPLDSWRRDNALYWPRGYGTADLPDVYLLCSPDFAWVPDPLREHPHAQSELFALYEQLLGQTGIKTVVLQGREDARLASALEAVDFSPL